MQHTNNAALRASIALGLALLLASCASIRTPAPAAAEHATEAQNVEAILTHAASQLDHGDAASLGKTLDALVHRTGFDDLPIDLRYRTLITAAMAAAQQQRSADALGLAKQATNMHVADATAWSIRLNAAAAVGDFRDAAHCVIVLIRRWPATLDQLNPDGIGVMHLQLTRSGAQEVDRALLDTLFDAHWQINGREPSILWRTLVLYHLADHAFARAEMVASRINSTQTVIGMLADKRFDAITYRHPRHFNVRRMLAAEIAGRRARMAAHPDELEPVTDLQLLFLMERAYPDVLAISDAAVAHVEFGQGKSAYVDFDRWYVWVLDYRARALMGEHRWSDALRVETRAASHAEQGSPNTSQYINLATWLANLRRPDEAAKALAKAGGTNAFGSMQLAGANLRIAIEHHDEPTIHAALAYMRAHRDDDPAGWQDALLLQDNINGAAAWLIHRLENPAGRLDALTDMQHYDACLTAPLDQLIQKRWRMVTTRADVQAALRSVGRVREYDLCAPII